MLLILSLNTGFQRIQIAWIKGVGDNCGSERGIAGSSLSSCSRHLAGPEVKVVESTQDVP